MSERIGRILGVTIVVLAVIPLAALSAWATWSILERIFS